MRLSLGARRFDLARRALVVAVLDEPVPSSDLPGLCRQAEQLVADGADVVEVAADGEPTPAAETVAALVTTVSPPAVVAVTTSRPEVADAAYRAGAVLGSPPKGPAGSGFLEISARAGAAVVLRGNGSNGSEVGEVRAWLTDDAHRAEATGVPSDRIILEPRVRRRLLPHLQPFAELGYPLLLTLTAPAVEGMAEPGEDRRALTLAAASLAFIGGCRLIRTDEVKGVRRVCDVLAAVLEAEA